MTIIYSSTLKSAIVIAIILLASVISRRGIRCQQVNPISFPQDDGLSAYRQTSVSSTAAATVPGTTSMASAMATTPQTGNTASFMAPGMQTNTNNAAFGASQQPANNMGFMNPSGTQQRPYMGTNTVMQQQPNSNTFAANAPGFTNTGAVPRHLQ